MSKAIQPIITVKPVFAGKQTDRQAFIDLILHKREIEKTHVDNLRGATYNIDHPERGIHSGMENCHECS